VAAISRTVRERRKAAGLLKGQEVHISASTPSGQSTDISIAQGDQIRFLVRNDDLGVVNGTVATVTKIVERPSTPDGLCRIRIEADVAGRSITFDPATLTDNHGRARLGWAYASTIYGAQGLTVDNAVIHLDSACNRHDIYVAASRARARTTIVVDARSIDRRLAVDLPFDRQSDDLVFEENQRRVWLAERLARASPKISTLDVIESTRPLERQAEQHRRPHRELSHEL
jgi:ATP-dependent exoDNAse (exonuclease V) alpha subunit